MKNFKKFVSLALVAAMTISCFTACGGKEEATNEESSGAETFKIGAIGPVTGAAAVYGQAVKDGAELAVQEINAAGGINGKQVEFNFQDDEHDAEKSVNAYNTLKDWGAQMILGSVTSVPCIAVGEETQKDNILQLTPSGTALECVQYDNAFRVCFSDPNQGVESAKYIAENGLATKIGIIYNSQDTYSSGIYEAFTAEAQSQGLEIVSAESFTNDSNTDFSVQVQKAKDAGAELLFLPFYYTEISLVLKEADKIGYEPVIFGVDGMDGILDIEGFDAALAEDVYFLSPFSPTSEDETVSAFVTSFEETYGGTPNQFAADAYDGIYILKQALEAAEATPDMSVSDICDAMKTSMTEITYDGVTAKGMTWDASGEPEKAPMILQIKGGAYVEL